MSSSAISLLKYVSFLTPSMYFDPWQFYLDESCIGKNRAEASLPKLIELNERVEIKVNNHVLDEETLKQYTV